MDHLTAPIAPPAGPAGGEPGAPAAPALLSDRFLVAFARLEEALKRRLGTNSKDSVRWLVRQSSKRDRVVAAVEDDLVEMAELRNAIVHERGGGFVIAEPHLLVVERLERIVEMILDPPLVEQVMSQPVVTCAPEEPMGHAARRMVRGGFSRLPVYAEGHLLGFLTANALARWLADRLGGPLHALHDEPVREVLAYGEAGRRFEVVARDQRVAEVVALFTASTHEGRRLEAVLVTETGLMTEPPLGIVTIQDLPRLIALTAA
jgi:predicted transcriptional regulator